MPISWWKSQPRFPLGELKLWVWHSVVGFTGLQEKEEDGVPGFISVGSPWGEPHCWFQQPSRLQPARGVFQDSAANFLTQLCSKAYVGSLLREISFWGSWSKGISCVGRPKLPDLKASWKGNSFIMKWQIKDIPAGFTSKQLLRAQAKPYYTPSQNKNKSHPDRFLYAGLYPSPHTFPHSPQHLPSSHPRH